MNMYAHTERGGGGREREREISHHPLGRITTEYLSQCLRFANFCAQSCRFI